MSAALELERARSPEPATADTRTLSLSGGLHLHALQWRCPAPTGPAAVLIHGLGDTAWVWDAIAPVLARRMDVIALEMRGHGRSDRGPPSGYVAPTMAADLRAAIDLLELDRPHLIGHSLGAAVAIHAAAAEPGRFASVALLDYAIEVPAPSLALVLGLIARMQATYACVDDYAQILRRRHPLAAPGLVEHIARGALHPVDDGFRQRFDPEVLKTLSAERVNSMPALLAQLTLPVHLVRGALSWMVSQEAAMHVVAACPSAGSSVVAMAGHSVHIDNAVGTLMALEAFLALATHTEQRSGTTR